MFLPRRLFAAGLAAAVAIEAVPIEAHAEPATPDEAKALAEKAAAHFRAVGPARACADFIDANAGFVDRELFVVVVDDRSFRARGAEEMDATALGHFFKQFFRANGIRRIQDFAAGNGAHERDVFQRHL